MNSPAFPHALGPGSTRGAIPRLSALAVALAVLVATALVLAPASASAAIPPRSFTGLQSFDDPTPRQWQGLRSARPGVFRMQFNWASVEANSPSTNCSTSPCEHDYRWGRYDRAFDRAALAGVPIMPVVLGSPGWASEGREVQDQRWAPLPISAKGRHSREALYDFIEAATRRYGPNGTHWVGKSAKAPAVYWQIWNEPNLPNYWHKRPNAREYAFLVKGSNAAAKRGNRAVQSVAAGLPWSSIRGSIEPTRFIRSMFKVSGVSTSLASVAVHPYTREPKNVVELVRRFRVALNGTSGKRRSIWITETGWSTGGPDNSFRAPGRTLGQRERAQAANLRSVYSRLNSVRRRYLLKGAVWFNLQDERPPAGERDQWYYNTGLIKRDGATAKPSWAAFKCITGAGRC